MALYLKEETTSICCIGPRVAQVSLERSTVLYISLLILAPTAKGRIVVVVCFNRQQQQQAAYLPPMRVDMVAVPQHFGHREVVAVGQGAVVVVDVYSPPVSCWWWLAAAEVETGRRKGRPAVSSFLEHGQVQIRAPVGYGLADFRLETSSVRWREFELVLFRPLVSPGRSVACCFHLLSTVDSRISARGSLVGFDGSTKRSIDGCSRCGCVSCDLVGNIGGFTCLRKAVCGQHHQQQQKQLVVWGGLHLALATEDSVKTAGEAARSVSEKELRGVWRDGIVDGTNVPDILPNRHYYYCHPSSSQSPRRVFRFEKPVRSNVQLSSITLEGVFAGVWWVDIAFAAADIVSGP